MSMKTSVVVANGTFATTAAPLLGTIEDVVRQAAEIGYDAISITVNRPEDVDVERLLSVCKTYGVAVSGLATGRIYSADGLSLSAENEEIRQAAVARMLEHARICAQLSGAKLIVGGARGWRKDASSHEIYERQFRKSMVEILAEAERLGVTVLLEAISRSDSDAYLTIAETAEYIRSFHSPALKLQIDSFHIYNNRETDFYHDILQVGDLLGQVDISDVDRMAPDGTHFDFPLFLKALEEVGYQEYLIFEFRAQPPENAARVGLEYICRLLEQHPNN